jgi:hypothetical protein
MRRICSSIFLLLVTLFAVEASPLLFFEDDVVAGGPCTGRMEPHPCPWTIPAVENFCKNKTVNRGIDINAPGNECKDLTSDDIQEDPNGINCSSFSTNGQNCDALGQQKNIGCTRQERCKADPG